MKFKNIIILSAICLLIVISNLLFYNPTQLIDIVSGQEAQGFSIAWNNIRYLIEPLYAFIYYGLTLDKPFYKPALISWTCWLVIGLFIYCAVKNIDFSKWLIKTLYAVLALATLFAFCAVAPIPGPKLLKPQNYIAVDIHSHSRFSHDNSSTEKFNVLFHRWAGYDAYFISEHNHTLSFDHFSDSDKLKTIFPAMQIQSRERGISLVLLSSEPFDGFQYKNLTIKDMLKKAHDNNMLAIMPHWWKWGAYSFQDLKNMGIDGFEIYNCGYRNFDVAQRQELIDFAKKNNLLMFGSTDWHGWGYMTDVWTVIEGNTKENLKEQLAKKPQTKVILYRQEQSGSIIRFIIEPIAAYYYYIRNADAKMLTSFILWFIILFIFFQTKASKIFIKWLPLALSIIFTAAAGYFLYIYIPVRQTNNMLFPSVFFGALGFALLWYALWKLRNRCG
ncbi:MAG: hypothetical protein LBN20_01265 [Endomicrobium sp.]|jgi:predicted metal-dependent phosphoesterase TrpH|nr:hypothetical protein [Endomicrobium sp.]